MHPFLAECAKKAPSPAISARNACFSRSRWQDPRLMHPFPGAIGRFRIHGARILPSRPPFRVEGPEIMHGAKMLPALLGLSRRRFAGRGPANWPNWPCALRPGLARLPHARASATSLVPAAPYARAAGSRTGRTGFVPCGPGLVRLPPAPAIRVLRRRKRAELHAQLNAGIKIGSPNGDPIKCSLVLPGACPTPCSPYGERTNLRFPTWKNYTKRTNLRFPTWITAPDRASGATL